VDDNTAGFTVKLVSISSPADTVTVIENRSLAGAEEWSRIRDVAIDASQLKIGDKYRIEIATTYRTGVTVVPGGSADYDDVVLRAKGVADGADGSASDALAGSGVVGNSATLTNRGKLQVKVRCARKAGGNCKMKVAGQLKKRGAKVGKATKAKVRSGKSKVVTLKVRQAARAKLADRKRIFVRQVVKANGHSAKKVVKLKLRHG
jgi:hypothetical protein